MEKTIIYYTSNREKPEFEKKIQDNIRSVCGDLPIISVSQKPTNFGFNIVVGDIGHSYLSEFKQILIGAKAAKTEYLIFTEADFLYPPDYFQFEPTGDNAYRNENVWLIFAYKSPKRRILHRFYNKPFSLGTQICKRDFIIREFTKQLNPDILPYTKMKTANPCVSFKTGDSMSRRNVISLHPDYKKMELPYWGTAEEVVNKYLC